MPQVRLQPPVTLDTRMCRRCGYAGSSMQLEGPAAVFDCPNCGEDLYARPPMSYAEMEGFDPRTCKCEDAVEQSASDSRCSRGRVRSALRRIWLRLARLVRG